MSAYILQTVNSINNIRRLKNYSRSKDYVCDPRLDLVLKEKKKLQKTSLGHLTKQEPGL